MKLEQLLNHQHIIIYGDGNKKELYKKILQNQGFFTVLHFEGCEMQNGSATAAASHLP